jgi:3-oxoacyl-[acyl-carrier-protein] synthase II
MPEFVRKTISLRRVVVTGIGMVSPVGIGVEEPWENIKKGKSGTGKITKFDTSELGSQVAGEVKDFDPLKYMGNRELRRNDPFIHYAIAASKIAWEDGGLKELSEEEKPRTGVAIGSGIGGLEYIANNQDRLRERGPRRLPAHFIPGAIINMASGIVSIVYQAKGPNLSTVTACATSTHSIGESFRLIETGYADIMITGGTESPITPLGVGGFDIMRALSRRNDKPEKASRPFDAQRDGFVIAEGSTVLILEELEHALKRGAKIYGEIIGFGMSGDAYHQTSPPPDGSGAILSMKEALKDADLKPEDIDYINAHGTSTPLNDKIETLAIKNVFGDYAREINISSTKSMTGHLLGATGAIEAAFSLMALRDGIIPATINYENPDPECDLNYTPNESVKKEIKYAISNSFGFGGTNATLVFKKYEK